MFEIIELAANATDLAILFYAVDRFSERKGKFNLKAIFVLLFIQSVFMRYTNELFGNASMASATVNIALFFFITSFFYKINLRQIIGVTAVILLAILICEGIVTTFMDAVLDTGMEGLIKYNSFYRAAAILISKAITAILAVNIFNFIDKEEISASKYFPVISAIVIVNILLHILMLEFYTGDIEKYIDTHIAVLVFFILINIINILSFFIIIRMIKYIEKETRWNMTVKGYEKQIEYLKSYNSVTTEMRKLRHDLTKHVIVLSDYLNSGRVKDAGNYINEILESYKSINEIASIQNKIISSIINYNIKITAENNIHFNFYADVPEKMHVKDIDIT